MCAEDTCKQLENRRNIQIIGTDISESILTEAKEAIYSEMTLSRGLDSQTKNRFFHKTLNGYELNAEIKDKGEVPAI